MILLRAAQVDWDVIKKYVIIVATQSKLTTHVEIDIVPNVSLQNKSNG